MKEIPTSSTPLKTFCAFFHKALKAMGIINKMFSDF